MFITSRDSLQILKKNLLETCYYLPHGKVRHILKKLNWVDRLIEIGLNKAFQ